MSDYSLTISIDRNQFQWLIENSYKLCIARRSEKGYTTVWQSLEHFNERHVFYWGADFQVFWLQKFEQGVQVVPECDPVPITFGQTITFQADKRLNKPGVPDDSGSFKVINECNTPIYVGLRSRIRREWNVCYVSPKQIDTNARETFLPFTSVKVWFQKNSESNSRITGFIGTAKEVDYTHVTKHSLSYTGPIPGAGDWTTGNGSVLQYTTLHATDQFNPPPEYQP